MRVVEIGPNGVRAAALRRAIWAPRPKNREGQSSCRAIADAPLAAHGGRIGKRTANRIGLTALRAPGVEHEIMEIPEDQIAIALILPKAVAAFRIELEQELALQQQFEQLEVEAGCAAASRLIF